MTKKLNKKLDDICEKHLPWWLNNTLRWLTCLYFLPALLILTVVGLLIEPFKREFRDGSSSLQWGWQAVTQKFNNE